MTTSSQVCCRTTLQNLNAQLYNLKYKKVIKLNMVQ